MKEQDSPAYKLLGYGTSNMTDSELLSIITGRSVEKVRETLSEYNVATLGKLNYHQLKNVGLSHTASIRLIASLELSRRKQFEQPAVIQSSRDAFNVMQPIIGHLDHEEQHVIFLNRTNRIIQVWKHSQGGISGTVCDVRLIMKKAIELTASAIVLAHNHPSGNTNPSRADIEMSKRFKGSAEILDIKVLDSLIICENAYTSFADEGII